MQAVSHQPVDVFVLPTYAAIGQAPGMPAELEFHRIHRLADGCGTGCFSARLGQSVSLTASLSRLEPLRDGLARQPQGLRRAPSHKVLYSTKQTCASLFDRLHRGQKKPRSVEEEPVAWNSGSRNFLKRRTKDAFRPARQTLTWIPEVQLTKDLRGTKVRAVAREDVPTQLSDT